MTLFLILINIVPIVLWGFYFSLNNPRRQGLNEILRIFILGMGSIIPIIISHQFLLNILKVYWSEYFGITTSSLMAGIVELILILFFIIFFVFIFILIQSLILNIFYGLAWRENFRIVLKKIYNLTPLIFFLIVFLILEVILKLGIKMDFIGSLAGSTMIFAVIEEYLKYMINPFLSYKKINSINAAIVNSLYVGLAFAFVENMLFFFKTQQEVDFMSIFIYRSIFTTLLHVCASGILGYFYGLSLFSESVIGDYEVERGKYDVMSRFRKFFGFEKTSIFQNLIVIKGFFIAATIHATFNFLVLNKFRIMAGILVVFLSLFIVYLLNLKKTHIQYGLIGSHEMPKEDFEKLRLKISIAQHLKEIQKDQTRNQ